MATGRSWEHFTRNGINDKIISIGANAGSSVTRKTNYLICGEKPGSKLTSKGAWDSGPDGAGVP